MSKRLIQQGLISLRALGKLTGWGATGLKNMLKNRETASERNKETDFYKHNTWMIDRIEYHLKKIIDIAKKVK